MSVLDLEAFPALELERMRTVWYQKGYCSVKTLDGGVPMRVSETTFEQSESLGDSVTDHHALRSDHGPLIEGSSGGQGNDSWSDAERLDPRFVIDRMNSSFLYIPPSLLTDLNSSSISVVRSFPWH